MKVRWGWPWLVLMVGGSLFGTGARAAPARRAATMPHWGRIANPQHQGERILSALYFAGPPNPGSVPLYTHHPVRSGSREEDDLRQMAAAGLNTIQLSYWGHDGEADSSAPAWLFSQTRWPGDPKPGKYTEAEQIALARRFFARAASHGLLVAPLLEVGPQFPFFADFPDNVGPLVGRAAWLLKNFGDEPNWLCVTDQNGQPRHVLWLLETIHSHAIDPETFAQGFGAAALQIKQQTGLDAGFILDPTPCRPMGPRPGRTLKRSGGRPVSLRLTPSTSPRRGLPIRPISETSPKTSGSATPNRFCGAGPRRVSH